MTQEQFFRSAEVQDGRFEFDGEQPVAMTGGTNDHSLIVVNVISELRGRLRGTSCRALSAEGGGVATIDRRIRYPDATVTCSPVRGSDRLIANPVVVFGVVSGGNARVYAASRWRIRHPAEIRDRCGYQPFSDPLVQFRLNRWLYALCWTGSDRPSALFDRATAWLIGRKVLLPGVTTLERNVARVRARAARRLWRQILAGIRLRAEGHDMRDEDVARPSPLGFEHINMRGRYAFTLPDTVARGELRPSRDPRAHEGEPEEPSLTQLFRSVAPQTRRTRTPT